MIAKDQQDLMSQYAQTIIQLVDNQQQAIQLKNDTLKQQNEVTIVHYQKNREKISKIKEEFEITQQYQEKIQKYIEKLDDIGNTIEGMESSVDYIDVILKRVEQKLEEIERIKA